MTQVKDLNRKRVCDISDDGKSAYIRRGDCITKITADTDGNLILPVSKGGTHARDNLMSLCQSCHTKIHHDLGDR